MIERGTTSAVSGRGRGALYDWHKNTYHKYCKAWAANGAIMEDLITNFELVGTRMLRICPVCNEAQDKEYDLAQEQALLQEQCPKCGFHFPYMKEQPSSFGSLRMLLSPIEDSSKSEETPST